MNSQNQQNIIERISVASDGTEANNYSYNATISNDGRFIVFESDADNLVPGNTNSELDFFYGTNIFIRDRENQTTERINTTVDGTEGESYSVSPLISGNGEYVVYSSYVNDSVSGDSDRGSNIFIYNRLDRTTESIITDVGSYSFASSITYDGRYITIDSDATNLVPGETDTNNSEDVFVYDRIEGTIERISVATDGTLSSGGNSEDSSITYDGRYVVFESNASNLVSGDTNNSKDIFIRDRVNQTTERISVGFDGTEANGSSGDPFISGNGRYITFHSDADNLVPGDTNDKEDVFVYDRIEGTTERVSVAIDGTQKDNHSYSSSISNDGRYIAFESEFEFNDAGNVNEADIFIYDRVTKTVESINTQANNYSYDPVLSGNGRYVAFSSEADNLVSGDNNDTEDVFVKDRGELISSQDMSRFSTDNIHRFYQYEKGFHLYTSDDNEINIVKERSEAGELSYRYEAEKFKILADDKDALTGETLAGVKPVYRFFNTDTGAHLYTMNEIEKSYIQDNLANYNFEGIKYYAFEAEPENIDTVPVYRMLNGQSGAHLFTVDRNEINYIQENLPHFFLESGDGVAFHVFEL